MAGQKNKESPVVHGVDVGTTPFSKREVGNIHKRFRGASGNKDTLYKMEALALPELAVNPFAERILELFSEEGEGNLTFTNFVDLLSAFSPRASSEVKAIWAFALWDFDGDDLIGFEDVQQGVMLTAGVKEDSFNMPGAEHFSMDTVRAVVEQVAAESDPDGWGINFTDFRNLLGRMPDFVNNFRLPTYGARGMLGIGA